MELSFTLVPPDGKHKTKKNGMMIRKAGAKRFIANSGKTIAVESEYRQQARNAMAEAGSEPILGPIELAVCFVFPIPKSRRKELKATVWRDERPDAPTLAEMICDALQGPCYADDAQIARLVSSKVWANVETPTVLVQIKSLENKVA